MSNIRQIPPELAMLFRLIGFGTVIEVEYDPNSPLSEEEQVAAAIAKAEAEHRETCADCRAEHEANKKAQPERRESNAGRRAGDLGHEAKNTDKATTDKATARDRVIVGYMAYAGEHPIVGTFYEVHDDVMGSIIEFTNGQAEKSGLTVKPVYG